MKVRIAFNLNKRTYSVRDAETGRVIDYCDSFVLLDPTFKVSEAGRQRVIKSGRKNVHAFIEGNLVGWPEYGSEEFHRGDDTRRITYNPYLDTTFVWKEPREAIQGDIDYIYGQVTHGMPSIWATVPTI